MRIDSVTLAAVVGGTVQGPAGFFSGIALDSRAAQPGDLFVALKGPHHDGHDHLEEALKNAAGALVSRSLSMRTLPPDRTLVRVPDPLAALRSLARYARETLKLTVVGITGSVGKTTTKEMTAELLSGRFRVARSKGNLNNTIGLPAELARIDEETQVAVLEMGMSTPGEIRLLSELARPDVAVITAVEPVHLVNFTSVNGILEAKAEILAGMSRDGVLVLNADDERVLSIGKRHRGRIVRYGLTGQPDSASLDITATEIVSERGASHFQLRLGGEVVAATLPIPGRHSISNFLAASAVAHVLGVPTAEIVERATGLLPAKHRGEASVLRGDLLLYDDSYNSSPAALLAAFEAFESVAGARRRIAVVGEMLELGQRSAEFHTEAGKRLGGRCDVLVAVRGDAAALAAGAKQAGTAGESIHFVADVGEAIPLIGQILRPGDALFVKGSRGVQLDRLVDAVTISQGSPA
ncbi:MAG: UDP-N-acetylmuramoyl-tripeptide--D-alanyl-D-alanine ligase [Thermoanaerobaculia bacterium]